MTKGKIEAPIAVLVTQTKIEIAPPPIEKAKPKAAPKAAPRKRPTRTVVVTQTHKAAKPEVKKAVEKRAARTPKTPALKSVHTPTPTPSIAEKNQEAVPSGRVPSRNQVEPGRYDMLLS